MQDNRGLPGSKALEQVTRQMALLREKSKSDPAAKIVLDGLESNTMAGLALAGEFRNLTKEAL